MHGPPRDDERALERDRRPLRRPARWIRLAPYRRRLASTVRVGKRRGHRPLATRGLTRTARGRHTIVSKEAHPPIRADFYIRAGSHREYYGCPGLG
jgi:hypothetical protein